MSFTGATRADQENIQRPRGRTLVLSADPNPTLKNKRNLCRQQRSPQISSSGHKDDISGWWQSFWILLSTQHRTYLSHADLRTILLNLGQIVDRNSSIQVSSSGPGSHPSFGLGVGTLHRRNFLDSPVANPGLKATVERDALEVPG